MMSMEEEVLVAHSEEARVVVLVRHWLEMVVVEAQILGTEVEVELHQCHDLEEVEEQALEMEVEVEQMTGGYL